MKLPLASIALCLFATSAAPAAVLVRVSGSGVDAAGCGTTSAPCRTLQFAHDQVDAGGYVVAIDPADFGSVVITKSITIANESAGAARISGLAAVDMDVPGGKVRLRGMIVEAEAYGIAGRANWLDVVDCVIQNGIMTYSRTGWADPHISLSNTRFTEGVAIYGMSRAMYAKNVRISGGIYLFSSSWGFAIEDSVLEGERSWGSNFAVLTAMDAVGVVRNSVLRNAPVGLDANLALVLLSKSTITGNALAFKKSSGQPTIQSFGDNVIRGNTDDALGLVTPAALH